MTPVFCGIDFGTSNSTVALADGETAWLMPVEAGDVTVPSAVFWHSEGPPAFGRAAIAAYADGERGKVRVSLIQAGGCRAGIRQGSVQRLGQV